MGSIEIKESLSWRKVQIIRRTVERSKRKIVVLFTRVARYKKERVYFAIVSAEIEKQRSQDCQILWKQNKSVQKCV